MSRLAQEVQRQLDEMRKASARPAAARRRTGQPTDEQIHGIGLNSPVDPGSDLIVGTQQQEKQQMAKMTVAKVVKKDARKTSERRTKTIKPVRDLAQIS